jgi:hypothetical protein
MSVSIPSGAIATVQVADAQTSLSPLLNAYDVVDAVSAWLSARQYSVRNTSVSGNIMSTISPLIQETFQAQLLIQMQSPTDTDSLSADVMQAFQDVTGKISSQVTIPKITTESGNAIATGQPGADPGVAKSIIDTIADFFTKIENLGTSLLIGLAAIVVLALVLIAYGPNIGQIAHAL